MKTAEKSAAGRRPPAAGPGRGRDSRRGERLHPRSGMTLIELLVAFVVLLMLIAALVTLTTRSLETWTSGEARKDVYDRAQVAIDLISADLRNLYAENEWYSDGMKPLPAPALQCDLDKNNRPRIRFVRDGNPAVMRAPAPNPPTILAPNYYGPMWEVAYVLDPDPSKNILYRGIRGFDRQKSGSLLNPIEYSSRSDPVFTSNFTPVEYGILYVGYKFWTQFTTTWDETVEIRETVKGRAKQSSGPEKHWDSTRRDDRNFHFYRKRNDLKDPDFVYPEIIQVVVTVESGSPDLHGVKLGDPFDEKSTYIHLTHTRGLPDAPGMVKIDGEWIEYGEKTSNDLSQLRRGMRHTKSAAHPVGTPVHFGETFTTDVRIPVFREAQEP
ncbi:MAG TPA: prepilin-type N-terminal cleavage/methylation domain-containing protein [Planctomycetota bacterium]|nr:prepilin-type N-terminal cleavage/methylation domain-containing protein [Planctomycetota bacterium]